MQRSNLPSDEVTLASEIVRRQLEGTDDVLPPRRLSRSVRAAKARNQRHREEVALMQSKHEDELDQVRLENLADKEAAEIDPLTKVCNRRGLERRHKEIIDSFDPQGVRRTDQRLGSSLFIDVDNFGQYNKEHADEGHIAGDRVLIRTVGNMKNNLRQGDVIARLGEGADEFVALLPGATMEAAIERAEMIRQANEELGVTVSIGVVPLENDLETLLKNGSVIMLNAKKLGRNRVFDPSQFPPSQAG